MFSLQDLLTRSVAEKTGFPVTVGQMKTSWLRGRFLLQDTEIRNSPDYPMPDFLVVPEMRVQAAPASLLTRSVHIREVSVHLKRVTGIRRADGRINIADFREKLEKKDEKVHSSSGPRRIVIDRLVFRMDEVVLVDYQHGGERTKYPVAINRTFLEVEDPLLLGPPLVENFAGVGLSQSQNEIFSTILPDVLWWKIRAILDPRLQHLISQKQ